MEEKDRNCHPVCWPAISPRATKMLCTFVGLCAVHCVLGRICLHVSSSALMFDVDDDEEKDESFDL